MQAIDSKEVVVDGFKYLIKHQSPDIAWDIGVELSKLIGEPGAVMATSKEGEATTTLAIAVRSFLSKVNSKDSWSLVKRLLSSVECQGPEEGDIKKILLNDVGIKLHFHGKSGSIIKLVSKVVEFTHTDFFVAIGDVIAEMMSKSE
jgi:hypothetical protein